MGGSNDPSATLMAGKADSIERFVREHLGGLFRVSGGREFAVPCPFHGDTRGQRRLWINANSGLWICYRCEESGGFGRLVRELAKDDPTIDVKMFLTPSTAEAHPLVVFKQPEPLVPFAAPVAVDMPPGCYPVWKPDSVPYTEVRRKRALAYLASRGVSQGSAEFYKIYVAIVGRYEGRILIPVFSAENRMVGWVARTLTDQIPKVLNTPASPTESIDDHIFNLNHAKGRYDDVVLVEGVFDAMRHGPNFLSLQGKRMKASQILALTQAKFKKITVLLDHDAAADGKKLAKSLAFHAKGCDVAWADVADAKDPGAATQEQVKSALSLRKAVAC